MCRQSAMPCLVKALPSHRVADMSLTERLVRLPEPRRGRGVRHPFVSVVLIAASAVVAGARSYTAIGQWIAAAPQTTLARLGTRVVGAFAVRIASGAGTIRRVLERARPRGPADLAGGDPAGATTVAVDGTSARDSRNGHVPSAHLLAAAAGNGQWATGNGQRAEGSRQQAAGDGRRAAGGGRRAAGGGRRADDQSGAGAGQDPTTSRVLPGCSPPST
ncbi:transposase family protein [Streptomyces sp. NPDC058470]|uniref:transposase family protein n=1 Tax=Streptomyces sp. NPDC058470 TaxID=3346515 RepID=UPI0036634068